MGRCCRQGPASRCGQGRVGICSCSRQGGGLHGQKRRTLRMAKTKRRRPRSGRCRRRRRIGCCERIGPWIESEGGLGDCHSDVAWFINCRLDDSRTIVTEVDGGHVPLPHSPSGTSISPARFHSFREERRCQWISCSFTSTMMPPVRCSPSSPCIDNTSHLSVIVVFSIQ